jgi:hypothetical protein
VVHPVLRWRVEHPLQRTQLAHHCVFVAR